MHRLSKNQQKILEILDIQPEMTTRQIAEHVFGKLVDYKTKEYNSIHRSIISLEQKDLVQRVHVQLKWRCKKPSSEKPSETIPQTQQITKSSGK
jgi:DNA-binding MarR family transcriptional regulator